METHRMHVALLHPRLDLTDASERLLATVEALVAAECRVSLLTRRGTLARALERAGAEIYSAELPEDSLRGFFAERRTASLVQELAPTLLHVTDEALASSVERIAQRAERPYVLEVMRPVHADRLGATAWRRALLIPCETFIEAAVNRGGAPRDSLRVLPHSPRLERSWTPRPLAEVERPVVATVGTLDDLHGTEVFLEAARRLLKKGRKLRFLILGEGPNELALRRKVREQDLAEFVTVASPYIPGLSSALRDVDLHVSCITSGSPGWCAVAALGLGLPSVFSAVNCTLALVEDKKSGLLVERNRPDKLVEQLEVLLDNPHAARRMGDVARQSLRQRELAAPYGKRLLELYEEALALSPA